MHFYNQHNPEKNLWSYIVFEKYTNEKPPY